MMFIILQCYMKRVLVNTVILISEFLTLMLNVLTWAVWVS